MELDECSRIFLAFTGYFVKFSVFLFWVSRLMLRNEQIFRFDSIRPPKYQPESLASEFIATKNSLLAFIEVAHFFEEVSMIMVRKLRC